ncbi:MULTISPECIES: porin [Achromobacter]|uniref:porin n=1 Tax=Achromobacter TaxID=222 RepID=UPI0006C43EC5|nr:MULTISPECIES: porin [Achromobacter]MCG2605449.1 porin [Achromobacter sp.]CAB3816427.1 Outer membrane porin protein [Achromobacter insuavis]CUI95149.1 Outer membrane porin protein BP0840 precursor [Achromobacter sp. 2789STDY5608621]CUK10230.1 Outer membrane porin protein BP0840 precursor [Achromobacter sp. 2789STDY5608615]
MKISTVATTLMAGAAWLPLAANAAGDGPGIQLYGVVDAGIATTHTSGQGTHNGVLNGGLTDSLWGLRGSEDLGDGWSTRFQLESGFDPSTGKRADDDRMFNYGAWVGLAHDSYGDLRLGRQYTVGKTYGNALELASWKEMGMGATFKASDNYQFSNLVNYYTPTWQGFQAGIGYSFDADDSNRFKTAANNRALSLGLKYEEGPLLAVATWDQLRLAEPIQGSSGRPQAVQLGASYDFEVFKVSAGWSRQRNGYVGLDGGDPDNLGRNLGPAAFARGGTVDAWLLGASVPVGHGAVVVQWSLARPDWKWEDGSSARNAQLVTLGYTYDLSPRTTLYAFAGYTSNYTLDNQFDPGHSHTSRFGTGISHRF